MVELLSTILPINLNKYVPLPVDEPIVSAYPRPRRHKERTIRLYTLVLLLVLEAVFLISIFVVYNQWQQVVNYYGSYDELGAYSQTTVFTENIDLVMKSKAAEEFWMKIQETDGVISVPTDWALGHGAQSSLTSPEEEGHSIYQIGMFHSIHCLDHIRSRIISKLPLEQWPRDDAHTLHCINFLRQQVTCHADLTLQETDDFLAFTKNDGRQCRNHEAIVQWVTERHWRGHRQYIKDKYGLK